MSDENFEKFEGIDREKMPVRPIPRYRIILCAEVPPEKRDLPHVFSIECGLHDGRRHFDHHGPHAGNPCPANNPKIVWYWDGHYSEDAEIFISHIDADCFLGISRLVGNGWSKKECTGFDYNIIEKVDVSGSSVLAGQTPQEYYFMVGLGEAFRFLKFPRCTKEPIDVTRVFTEHFEWFCDDRGKKDTYTLSRLVEIGMAAHAKVEETYFRCMKVLNVEKKTGYWVIDAADSFDPSFPYAKGAKIVVVYRKHYKTISAYADPTLSIDLRRTYDGIEFAGHAKACGSPRGVEITEEMADDIYSAIEAKWTGKIV